MTEGTRPSGAARRAGRRALLVAGMHRSGTSAMTRVLNLLGAALPRELTRASSDNATGFWEGRWIVSCHAGLLGSLGSAWDDAGALPRDWLDRASTAAREEELLGFLREDFADAPLFAVKDPRLSRLAPLWLRLLGRFGADPAFVVMLRHPEEVARSLEARDGFGRQKSFLLWLVHLVEAERNSRGLPRAFVPYEGLLDEPVAVLDAVGERLALRWPSPPRACRRELASFLSHEHRHHVAGTAEGGSTALDDWVAEGYALARRVASGEVAGDEPAVLAAFDELAAYVRAVQLALPIAAEATSPAELRAEAAARAERIGRLRERLARSERQRLALRARLDAIERRRAWRIARRMRTGLRLALAAVPGAGGRGAGS